MHLFLSGGGLQPDSAASVLISILITPANPSVSVGKTQQFKATGTFTGGTTRDLTPSVTWTSSKIGQWRRSYTVRRAWQDALDGRVLTVSRMTILLDVHVTDGVRSRVVPPVNVPVALNCCVFPTDTEGFAGVIRIEIRTLAAGVWL